MKSFAYSRATSNAQALEAARTRGTQFLAGGTNLVDLMKYQVEQPVALVDINHLALTEIRQTEGGISIGAMVRNSNLANHPLVRTNYPLLSQALLSGASPQLRNMASTGGNLMQRTRCYYFNDVSFSACNKRAPGSGCAALEGYNRIHAVLGQTDKGPTSSETCIATHPSDMCVALAALDPIIHVLGTKGIRQIPFSALHLLPGTTPHLENTLRPGELITAVELPSLPFAARSYYLKVRDRASYEFALASAAVALEIQDGQIRQARVALGGVGTKPWRSPAAEQALIGAGATKAAYEKAATAALHGASTQKDNAFKPELARRTLVRALLTTAQLI
jgi:xanthine dehydrogenase YagS FAD-binding subunit